ncbi:hypothetical protein HK102_012696, partial [Quaeritorhiza haematococci]
LERGTAITSAMDAAASVGGFGHAAIEGPGLVASLHSERERERAVVRPALTASPPVTPRALTREYVTRTPEPGMRRGGRDRYTSTPPLPMYMPSPSPSPSPSPVGMRMTAEAESELSQGDEIFEMGSPSSSTRSSSNSSRRRMTWDPSVRPNSIGARILAAQQSPTPTDPRTNEQLAEIRREKMLARQQRRMEREQQQQAQQTQQAGQVRQTHHMRGRSESAVSSSSTSSSASFSSSSVLSSSIGLMPNAVADPAWEAFKIVHAGIPEEILRMEYEWVKAGRGGGALTEDILLEEDVIEY